MSKKKNGIVRKYHPNYKKLYPEVEFSEELMVALNESDRKIKYVEYDLKHETPKRNRRGDLIDYMPPRECSLEDFIGASDWHPETSPSAEETYLKQEQCEELNRYISLLTEYEQALIYALYFDKLTEKKFAARIGKSQQYVNKLRKRVLCKLLNLMNRGC